MPNTKLRKRRVASYIGARVVNPNPDPVEPEEPEDPENGGDGGEEDVDE